MTPQITILALAVIAAALSVIAALQRVYINRLKADATYARYKAEKQSEHFEELIAEAKAEADNEYQLRRQAERNLAAETDHAKYWEDLAKEWCEDVTNEKTRSFNLEKQLSNYARQRDPKTGRFYSAKKKAGAVPPEVAKHIRDVNKSHAAFDAMMGNAIEQLQGLTVRKLCDEVKDSAGIGI